jgi:protein-tyrosine-phosphatase
MFAEILRKRLQLNEDNHRVESVGIIRESAGKPAAQEWSDLRGFTGIDLVSHRSRYISDVNLEAFDLVVSLDEMGSRVLAFKHRVPASRLLSIHIPNPYLQGVRAYVECFHAINRHMVGVLRRILGGHGVTQGSSVK